MKKFYTEKDIEDLFKSGVKTLQVGDDVALTELAYEKAARLGMQLISGQPDNPPSAPVRPYLSEPRTVISDASAAPVIESNQPTDSGLAQRIRAAVIARLGDQVDARLVDNIIARVLKSTGLK